MEYAIAGKSGLNISRISLGCMSLPVDEKQATSIILRSYEAGVNYFDTADIYNDGQNEIVVGKALKSIRRKVFIASKAGNVRRPDGGLDWNPTAKHILKCIDESLKRLDTDYIDLYQLHGGTINDNFEETVGAFERLKQEGKILHYGISSIRPNVIARFIRNSAIVSDMIQYSLLDRRPEEECLTWLKEANVGVFVRGSLAQGLLVNKPEKTYLEHSPDSVRKASEAVSKLAIDGRSKTHVALRYVLQHPSVTSAVVGIRTDEQLNDVLKVFETPALNNDEMSYLKSEAPAFYYREHRI